MNACGEEYCEQPTQIDVVLQRLESELRVSREPELSRIRDKVQSIVTVAGPGGAVELTAIMSQLNLKLDEVQQRILAANSKFQAASSNLAACRSMFLTIFFDILSLSSCYSSVKRKNPLDMI